MKSKLKGSILYTKKIKDHDLFIKILSSDDSLNSGLVYGGNSTKKKLIFPSSTSVYGTQSKIVDEECTIDDLKPQSPYAEVKLIEENYDFLDWLTLQQQQAG